MSEKEWFTIKDACEYLQVSHMTIHRWMKSGKLSYFKMGGGVRFKQENLDQVASKKTGQKEAEEAANQCAVCGNNEMIDGRIQGMGRIYFKPDKTKFFVFEESLIPMKSTMCTSCGNVQMFADTQKFERLRPEQ